MTCLVSFAGLPATGKTSIARALSRQTGIAWLRIDEIDAAIWARDPERDIGPESYHIAAALAASNLELGHSVITDCVNPWPITRGIFAAAATRAGVALLAVEVICSDARLHRDRAEARRPERPGHHVPTWDEILRRPYERWTAADLVLDTALLSVDAAVERVRARLGTGPGPGEAQ